MLTIWARGGDHAPRRVRGAARRRPRRRSGGSGGWGDSQWGELEKLGMVRPSPREGELFLGRIFLYFYTGC